MSFLEVCAYNVVYSGYPYSKIPAILKPIVKEFIIGFVGAENTELLDKILAS